MSHESVEDEELADNVDTVQDLHEHVEAGQVCALAFVTHDQTDFGRLLLHTDHKVIVVLTVGIQPAVDVDGDVLHRLVSLFGLISLGSSSHGDDFLEVESGVAVQHSPDETGDLEEKCHEDQDDGHPLIVGQLLLAASFVVQGDGFLQRNIVRVFNPAVGFRIRYIRPRKLRRTPALDGVPYVLSASSKYCKDTQEHHGVDVVDPVHPVVVVVTPELVPARPAPKNPHNTETYTKTMLFSY